MFFMSGDSTKEWDKYLFSGSSGWSIRNAPPPLMRVPITFTSPSKYPAQPTAGICCDAVDGNSGVSGAKRAHCPRDVSEDDRPRWICDSD